MHEIKTGKTTIMLVEVEQDAANFGMSGIGNLHYDHSFEGGILNMCQIKIVNLFDASLKFLCTTTDITEDIAAGIVGNRIIHRIVAGAGVGGEHCGVSGCPNKSHGLYFAMIYEGEYCDNEIISAGTPVCAVHARDSLEEFASLLQKHSLTGRYAIILVK